MTTDLGADRADDPCTSPVPLGHRGGSSRCQWPFGTSKDWVVLKHHYYYFVVVAVIIIIIIILLSIPPTGNSNKLDKEDLSRKIKSAKWVETVWRRNRGTGL